MIKDILDFKGIVLTLPELQGKSLEINNLDYET